MMCDHDNFTFRTTCAVDTYVYVCVLILKSAFRLPRIANGEIM